MPVYEYACEGCGHEFEQYVRSMTDRRRPPCPQCGAARIERRMSVFAARERAPRSSAAAATCGRPECGGGQCRGLTAESG